MRYAICNEDDVEETKLPPKPVRKKHEVSAEMTTKIINLAKLYQMHPEFFIPAFKKLKGDTVLNYKMKSRYPDHSDRKLMYRAISYVEKLVNDEDEWKVATIRSSNYYRIPYKDLESLMQIKTAKKKL